jgi:hypothetical protein
VERLPIPLEEDAAGSFDDIGSIARALSRSADSALESRLNAHVARLYQLTNEEFLHVLSTFPLIAKHDRNRAMEEFRRS